MVDITASNDATRVVWRNAIKDYLDYSGTPVGDLEAVDDFAFILGPIFCAVMKLLSGLDPQGASVQKNIMAMRTALPDASAVEKRHALAVEFMVQGEFSQAARTWDELLQDEPEDVLAHKCAHETWFLIGDVSSMLRSTSAVIDRINPESFVYSVAAAQHGLALEENGDYQAAEGWGRLALDMVPTDCWALHCLAHVYESQNRHNDIMDLIQKKQPIWSKQNLLNAHIWWHLSLRLIEAKDFDGALGVFDDNLCDVPANNRFRLTDGTSLLWRLQLEGVDVGNRWGPLAQKWAVNASLHANPFLDLHAMLAFSECKDTTAARVFFDSLEASYQESNSELAKTYNGILKPLVTALADFKNNPSSCANQLKPLLPSIYKIGGSIVQRELVERSYSSALLVTNNIDQVNEFLNPKLKTHPNTPWLLRASARSQEISGNTINATLLNRRADMMFKQL